MKLWKVAIDEGPKGRERKARHTVYIVHSNAKKKAEEIALDRYFMELPHYPVKVTATPTETECFFYNVWKLDVKAE